MSAWPVAATLTVYVPRHAEQPPRQATLSVRYGPVTLRPPRHRRAETARRDRLGRLCPGRAPASGRRAAGVALLTTWAVATVAAAVERVEWYGVRFGIEVWHKGLKSGCRIEARQLESGECLQRCLPLYSIIAWRILYATLLSRALPELSCTVLLALEEWQALYCAIHHTPTPPPTPPTLQQAGAGLPAWAAFWRGAAMASRARRCCGKAFNIGPISPPCIALCAPPSPKSRKCG